MNNTGITYLFEYSSTASTSAWLYDGDSSYFEQGSDHGDCIKVDKGQPDKAQHVIFYAEIDMLSGQAGTDPMIFCKDKKELDKEMKKLMKRSDIAKDSIRVFNLAGGIKKND